MWMERIAITVASMDRVAEHRFVMNDGELRVRVDLHGVGVFSPDGARTLIPWENISRIGAEPGAVCVESFTARITLPSGAFGLAEEDLARQLERGRSIDERPSVISDLVRAAEHSPRTKPRPWPPRAASAGPAPHGAGRRLHDSARNSPVGASTGSSRPHPTSASADSASNLLGALALLLADRISEAMTDAADSSFTTTSALVALDQLFLHSPSVGDLSEVLDMSPSGAVRLVDRLEQAGYVVRQSGFDMRDRRRTTLRLTATGREVAQRAMAARAAILESVLAVLSPSERQDLETLLARVLAGSVGALGTPGNICRSCDTEACGRWSGRCPVARQAQTPSL